MHPVVKASLILVAVVAFVSVVIYVTGIHENFLLNQILFLAVAIVANIVAVFWALSQTAETRGYGKQVFHATGIGLLAGALIIGVSWLLLAVVFPDVLTESTEGAIAFMESSGMAKEELARQMETLEKTTPMSQSLAGGIGTFVTSLVVGLIVAVFKRKK